MTISGVFAGILTCSFYGSVAGLVILFIKWVLKERMSPRWHYLVWIVLILRLIVPCGPESAISLFNAVPQVQQVQIGQIESALDAIQPDGQTPAAVQHQGEASPCSITAVEAVLPYLWLLDAILLLLFLLYTNWSLQRRLKRSGSAVGEPARRIFLTNAKRK